MYHYHVRLVLVTLDSSHVPQHLFDPLPTTLQCAKDTHSFKHNIKTKLVRSHKSRGKPRVSSSRPNAPPTPIRSAKQSHPPHLTDYPDFRLGPVTIESFRKSDSSSKVQEHCATECGYGILHVYRDIHDKPPSDSSPHYACILAVPSFMQLDDLLHFIRDANCDFRVIRDHAPNKYTVILKFNTSKEAQDFEQKYNGKQFNVSEPEICHIVFLEEAPIIESMVIDSNPTPLSLHDTLKHDQQRPDRHELPTCPVCLERMDDNTTGLRTIVCEHNYECYCLTKWGDTDCPTCRYSQKPIPEGSSGSKRSVLKPVTMDDGDSNECFVCGATDSLWICMVCGHIGCGRYQDAHAYDHYMETKHSYALEIETQHVWDYVGDGYVHRLIQNTDGSLVELESSAATGSDDRRKRITSQDKMEMVSQEYSQLLNSQLESQRMYYEEQVAHIEAQISSLKAQKKSIHADINNIKLDNENQQRKSEELDKELADIQREKTKLERRLELAKAKSGDIEKEWKEEKEMTDSLKRNNELLKKELDEQDQLVDTLNEHIQSLMKLLENPDDTANKQAIVDAALRTIGSVNKSTSTTTSSSSSRTLGSRKKGKKKVTR
ncbi:hypothetical protein LRAMOSA01041 [Lichtheimia ramosa]|uniref:BRCA1-associated protein n=1 Tax=Lichtheimia ramosa TaxID=688394 RepID=A0A077WAN9_9FUNG|nr:hypothetical protein LRAMOSA01041 [Lichtheimia ramosa]